MPRAMKRYRRGLPPRRMARQPTAKDQASNRWGRVSNAFIEVIDHIKETPEASVLLAAGTSQTFVTMHSACEYHLPQAGGWRVAGVWFFPNKARLRIARVSDMHDAAQISSRRFSLIAIHAEAEVVAVLQPLLLPNGRIIPFLGTQ